MSELENTSLYPPLTRCGLGDDLRTGGGRGPAAPHPPARAVGQAAHLLLGGGQRVAAEWSIT